MDSDALNQFELGQDDINPLAAEGRSSPSFERISHVNRPLQT
jgi:hypothetical protein